MLRQLDAGCVELQFNGETETCHIVPVEGNPRWGGGAEYRRQREVSVRVARTVILGQFFPV